MSRWISFEESRQHTRGNISWWACEGPNQIVLEQRQFDPKAPPESPVYLYENGDMYFGQWKKYGTFQRKSKPGGLGAYCSQGECVFIGEWDHGRLNGLTKLLWLPASTCWTKNEDSASGIQVKGKGVPFLYVGNFCNDVKEDQVATVILKDGTTKTGPWKDDKPVGDWWKDHKSQPDTTPEHLARMLSFGGEGDTVEEYRKSVLQPTSTHRRKSHSSTEEDSKASKTHSNQGSNEFVAPPRIEKRAPEEMFPPKTHTQPRPPPQDDDFSLRVVSPPMHRDDCTIMTSTVAPLQPQALGKMQAEQEEIQHQLILRQQHEIWRKHRKRQEAESRGQGAVGDAMPSNHGGGSLAMHSSNHASGSLAMQSSNHAGTSPSLQTSIPEGPKEFVAPVRSPSDDSFSVNVVAPKEKDDYTLATASVNPLVQPQLNGLHAQQESMQQDMFDKQRKLMHQEMLEHPPVEMQKAETVQPPQKKEFTAPVRPIPDDEFSMRAVAPPQQLGDDFTLATNTVTPVQAHKQPQLHALQSGQERIQQQLFQKQKELLLKQKELEEKEAAERQKADLERTEKAELENTQRQERLEREERIRQARLMQEEIESQEHLRRLKEESERQEVIRRKKEFEKQELLLKEQRAKEEEEINRLRQQKETLERQQRLQREFEREEACRLRQEKEDTRKREHEKIRKEKEELEKQERLRLQKQQQEIERQERLRRQLLQRESKPPMELVIPSPSQRSAPARTPSDRERESLKKEQKKLEKLQEQLKKKLAREQKKLEKKQSKKSGLHSSSKNLTLEGDGGERRRTSHSKKIDEEQKLMEAVKAGIAKGAITEGEAPPPHFGRSHLAPANDRVHADSKPDETPRLPSRRGNEHTSSDEEKDKKSGPKGSSATSVVVADIEKTEFVTVGEFEGIKLPTSSHEIVLSGEDRDARYFSAYAQNELHVSDSYGSVLNTKVVNGISVEMNETSLPGGTPSPIETVLDEDESLVDSSMHSAVSRPEQPGSRTREFQCLKTKNNESNCLFSDAYEHLIDQANSHMEDLSPVRKPSYLKTPGRPEDGSPRSPMEDVSGMGPRRLVVHLSDLEKNEWP